MCCALKPLIDCKLPDRYYDPRGHRTHLLPHLSWDLFVDPVHSPWHSLSLAKHTHREGHQKRNVCLPKDSLIKADGSFKMLIMR